MAVRLHFSAKSILRFLVPAVLIAGGLSASVALSQTGVSLGEAVRLPVARVSVTPAADLPEAVKQLEVRQAGAAFDGDVSTGYTAYGKSTLNVRLAGPQTVTALRLYGPAPYSLSVSARHGDKAAFQPLTGLQNLDLAALPKAWSSFAATAPVTASELQITLTPLPQGGGSLSGIEIWGQGRHANMAAAGTLFDNAGKPLAPQALTAEAVNIAPGDVTAVGAGQGEAGAPAADASFRFNLPVLPAQIARAYLVYELNGAMHWSEAARSLNGAPSQGGDVRRDASSFTLQAEPIAPAQLQAGLNTITFSNSVSLPPYQLRHVRLVIEPLDGWNAIAGVTSNQGAADSVLDGDNTTGWTVYPASQKAAEPALAVTLAQMTAADAVRFQLSQPLTGTLSLDVLTAGGWQTLSDKQPGAQFAAGWNRLPLPGLAISGARLRFSGGDGAALVTELAVTGSPAAAATPALAITFPDHGQYYGDAATVRGFVRPASDDSGPAKIVIGGKPVSVSQGAFEASLSRADLGIAASATEWSAEVTAVYPGGAKVSQTVKFSTSLDARRENAASGLLTADLAAGAARTLTHHGASLEIGAGATDKAVRITMQALKESELPALGSGLVNVTKGGGYRFLPHGRHFKKQVKVRLPYDKAKLPEGAKESDIKTFYFDTVTGAWQPLQTAATDTAKGEIHALTGHFTDMINGVVQTPDSPEAASFNPTQIKDLKAADPGAKVNLIAPPQANAMGDVRLSYPIELPAGRTGHAPQLALSYSSSGENGWLGTGWNLGVSSIAADTRWGVPRYDGANETETYTADGEQLAPVAHRGPLVPRVAERTFNTRVEGSFRKITRHGSSPSTYWWEVRDKDGTASYYGGDPAAGAPVPDAVLADANGNIFKWLLRLVQDTNGNTIHYNYARVSDSGTGDGASGVPGTELYLQSIDYSGTGSTPGAYTVEFTRDRDLGEPRRSDPIISARGGFKMVTADLLRKVSVSYLGQPVRSYELIYQEGAYKKSLLASLKQFDKDGTLFNQHTFSYYDDSRNGQAYRGFTGAASVGTGADGVEVSGPLGSLEATALGTQSSSGFGAHLYVGVGTMAGKSQSVGAKVGGNASESEGLLAFIDIDGDGLPDKVFRSGGQISYRKNTTVPGGAPAFGASQTVASLPAISRENTSMISAGPEAYAGISYGAGGVHGFAGLNLSSSQAEQTVYFMDVNGDGLVDLVADGTVLFNHLSGGVPSFTGNSADTPNPIGAAAVAANLMAAEQAAMSAKLDAANPKVDTLRRWVAPFAGTVAITAPVNLIQDTSTTRAAYKTADGVRAAIQQNGTELWSARIQADDYAVKTPTGVSAVSVAKGDALYFRVQSVDDGAYDAVNWAPQIAYQGAPANAADANNLNPYAYDLQTDFTLHGLRQAAVGMPADGTVQVTGGLNKLGPLSDDVTLVLTKNGTAIFSQIVPAASTGITQINQSVTVQKVLYDANGNQTRAADMLELKIVADSRVDVTKLAWDAANPPTIAYTSSPDVPQGGTLPSMEFPVSVSLYPASDQTQPLEAWTAPSDGNYTFTASATGSVSGSLTVTAKKPGVLLAKQAVTPGTDANLSVSVKAGDKVFFEFQSSDPDAPASLTYGVSGSSGAVPAALYTAAPASILPQDYRGWTQFGYNGQGTRATAPISITSNDLTLAHFQNINRQSYQQQITDAVNNGTDPAAISAQFDINVFPYMPNTAKSRWQGADNSLWASAASQSSSRRGIKFIPSATSDVYAGAAAVARISHTSQRSFALSAGVTVGPVGGNAGVTFSQNTSRAVLDFKDLNGDGYPDVVTSGLTVQYSPMTGGLEGSARSVGTGGDAEDSSGENNSYGIGGTYAQANPNHHADQAPKAGIGGSGGNTSGSSGLQMPPLSLGATLERGNSSVDANLIDVNGDGLPDRVTASGGTLTVQINLGYGFAAPETWGSGVINSGETQGQGISGGFNDGIYGFAGGVNLSDSNGKAVLTLFDVNGDGLPDVVSRDASGFQAAFNTGAGFAAPVPFRSGLLDDMARSKTKVQGGGVYFEIVIPIGYGFAVILNPGADVSMSAGRTETLMADIDGDGYPDFLSSTSDGTITASLNTHGRTNILRQVNRPLGGFFTVDYSRSGDTYAQPHNRWVLSNLVVNDGQPGDGQDTEVTSYAWTGGLYERRERQFYGFAQCVESHLDPANGNAPYRTVTRAYNNTSYYLKGTLAQESLADAQGRKFTEAAHTYAVRNEADQQPLADPADLTAVGFPQLVRTDKSWFEGQPAAAKSSYETFAYDKYGNVTAYLDGGDSGPSGVRQAQIAYHEDLVPYIVGKARSITVLAGGQTARQRSATFQPGTGDLLQVVKTLADGTQAVTGLTYDSYGNIATVTGPANATGQRYARSYTYDPSVHTYVTSVSDSFGYTSTAEYDFRFGVTTRSTDLNNQSITTAYDAAGRPSAVTGSYQQGTGLATITMAYHPEAAIPWAQTKHLDLNRGPSATIDLETFTDGLGRATQIKKSLALHASGDSASDVTSVSGRVVYDGLGRAIQQFYPTTEPLGQQTVFNPAYDTVQPTLTTYDVLDRPLTVANPANETTRFAYDFGADRNGAPQFRTTVTDANNIPRQTFRNARNNITAVRLVNNGGSVSQWTSYTYDALDQILQVRDDKGNLTSSEYDNFGRRTAIVSPDAGRTEYVFDPASNLTRKVTANLKAAGLAVNYSYQFNRLAAVTYPQNPKANAAYTYGGPGAANGQAGRLARMTAEGGPVEHFYGPLGEVVKEIRTPAKTVTTGPDPVFTTLYTYDTWNRIQSLTYPDGEVLTFKYDSGGNIRQISGQKQSLAYPYLTFLGYDKFEARERVAYGNGTHQDYAYNPLNRRITGLLAATKTNRTFMNMAYGYDAVGNVKSLANAAAVPANLNYLPGCQTAFSFGYDDLYQLTSSTASCAKPGVPTDKFTLSMTYDSIHNITRKTQAAVKVLGGSTTPNVTVSYDWTYTYGGTRPHAASRIGNRAFLYDLDGNQAGWDATNSGQNRRNVWDEDDRLKRVTDDNGQPTTFKYDGDTNRVVKTGTGGEMLYVNPWYVAKLGRNSKHVFAGTTRIVTKLETFPTGEGYGTGARNLREAFQYFYHPDHLGSTAYATDATGEVSQHLEYFPFGETWVDEVNGSDRRVPYRFTGKEIDPETKLYYYGARYYDPRTSAWQSADPIIGHYLDGKGKANPLNLASYSYVHNRPLVLIDPDGLLPDDPRAYDADPIARNLYRKTREAVKNDYTVSKYAYAISLSLYWRFLGGPVDSFHTYMEGDRVIGSDGGLYIVHPRTGELHTEGELAGEAASGPMISGSVASVPRGALASNALIRPGGMRFRAAQAMKAMGLGNVQLANSSYNSGRKALGEAGFALERTTSTGRKVFRHPQSQAEVYYDSGAALAFGQKPHWHVRDAAGNAYSRTGRIVGTDEPAGHIPAAD